MEYPTKEADQGEFSVKDFQENYHTGWIKLYRSVRKHWIYENALYFRAWIDILMEVNHEGKKVLIESELIYCDRGESIYSIQTWIKIFGKEWSRQKVRTFFELLEKDGMIVTKGMRKTTKLTVINYNTYQDMLTNRQPTANQQLTNRQPQLKNVKNDKKKDYANSKGEFHKLQNWIWENLPHVSKMEKQVSFSEAEKLVAEFDKTMVKEVLEAMENYKGVEKKNISVNLTLRNWIKRRLENNNGKFQEEPEKKVHYFK